MGGVFNGRPHRNGGHEKPRSIPTMPKLSALGQDMDPVEARRLQLWGENVINEIRAFRHRQMRRREGVMA